MPEAPSTLDELATLHAGLDELSYYAYLGVEPACDYLEIREAYYRRAQRFHPDRFLQRSDEEVRSAAYSVYKRIAEAYNVLIDPQLRIVYDEARAQGQHRLSDLARSRRLSADARQVTNPFARVYIRSAREKLSARRVESAWVAAKLGLSLEDARAFRLLIEEIESDPEGETLRGPRR